MGFSVWNPDYYLRGVDVYSNKYFQELAKEFISDTGFTTKYVTTTEHKIVMSELQGVLNDGDLISMKKIKNYVRRNKVLNDLFIWYGKKYKQTFSKTVEHFLTEAYKCKY